MRTILLILVLQFGIAVASAAGAATAPPLFETREVRSANLKAFAKWTDMLARHLEDLGQQPGSCAESRMNACHYQKWQARLEALRDASALTQIAEVNAFMNRAKYIVDPINWNKKDYWATPRQFFRKDGDCEDYAIAKFITLKALGFDPDSMRIVVLQDLNLRVPHAVLAVYHRGRILILDNQIKRVVDATTIRHYRPVFSINETAWWLHRAGAKAGGGKPKAGTGTGTVTARRLALTERLKQRAAALKARRARRDANKD